MDIFSAAISLLAAFLCLILCVPIILLLLFFFGYDKLSPKIQSGISSLFKFVAKLLKINIPSTSKPKTSRKRKENKKVENKVKYQDAEFRDIEK